MKINLDRIRKNVKKRRSEYIGMHLKLAKWLDFFLWKKFENVFGEMWLPRLPNEMAVNG